MGGPEPADLAREVFGDGLAEEDFESRVGAPRLPSLGQSVGHQKSGRIVAAEARADREDRQARGAAKPFSERR